MDHTPEQQNSLKSWAARRDEILRDIAKFRIEQEGLIKSNNDGNEAFSEVQGRITHAIGRLDELDRLEESKKLSLSKDVADLQVQHSVLQGKIETANTELKGIESKKESLINLISTFGEIFGSIIGRATALEESVGHIAADANTFNTRFTELKGNIEQSTQEIVEKNSENVKQTNIVLSSIHKYIFELQKPIPVRRVDDK